MRNFDEHSITDAVLASLSGTTDPRQRAIGEALVRHLHAFVREVEPTEAEWAGAIDFLTRTGQISDGNRQEFILLSDTLGVSMLVDAINHRLPGAATETTVLGPFYVDSPPEFPLGADISAGAEGAPLLVEGSVHSDDGRPLAGAILDVWHSDEEGSYDVQREGDLAMRARLRTDTAGAFRFWTVQPAAYPIPSDGPVGAMLAAQGRHPFRPAHVHFMIDAPGHVRLVTHVFVAGDRYLDSDVVFGVKDSLVRTFERQPPGRADDGRTLLRDWVRLRYDFVLAPEKPA